MAHEEAPVSDYLTQHGGLARNVRGLVQNPRGGGRSGFMSRKANYDKTEQLDPENFSELVIGIAAAVGTPLNLFVSTLTEQLTKFKYNTQALHLSKFSRQFELGKPEPDEDADEYTRINCLMDLGNELRRKSKRNDVFALCAIGEIHDRRPKSTRSAIPALVGNAFVLRQLKRPEEVYTLRQVYGNGFHMVGLYCPQEIREEYMRIQHGILPEKAALLIERDEKEAYKWGQDLTGTFHLSDVFLDASQNPTEFEKDLRRWLEILFGTKIHSPTVEEFGMFQATGAALRSAQLSRQVGAAVLGERGEVLSVGVNEVPCFGGGQYWPHHEPGADCQGEQGDVSRQDLPDLDARDHKHKSKGEIRDSNDQIMLEILEEILEKLVPDWIDKSDDDKQQLLTQAAEELSSSRVMNLTEFGRAVHAEMEAILAAARTGVSLVGKSIFVTTFPCHNCTKHIVGTGIRKVVYIEPYPKSLAPHLHDDAIAVEEEKRKRVRFRPFVGVAPRRYIDLFSMRTVEGRKITRKDESGRLIALEQNLRLKMPYFSALQRETKAAKEVKELAVERRDTVDER